VRNDQVPVGLLHLVVDVTYDPVIHCVQILHVERRITETPRELSGEERCPRIVAHEHHAATRACELFDEVVHGAGEVCGAEVGAGVDECGEAAGDKGLEALQSGGRRVGNEPIEGGLVWAISHKVAQLGQSAQIWRERVVFGGAGRTGGEVIAKGVD
jgi:hypothetical protein